MRRKRSDSSALRPNLNRDPYRGVVFVLLAMAILGMAGALAGNGLLANPLLLDTVAAQLKHISLRRRTSSGGMLTEEDKPRYNREKCHQRQCGKRARQTIDNFVYSLWLVFEIRKMIEIFGPEKSSCEASLGEEQFPGTVLGFHLFKKPIMLLGVRSRKVRENSFE